MALKFERDPVTGHQTTGHEWNGIKELNTPVPKIVFLFLGITILFLIFWTTIMPAWPLVTTYTKGLLGADQRTSVEQSVATAEQARAVWTAEIDSRDYDAILSDPDLMHRINETAQRVFGDNCAACHGVAATGGPGYPNLAEAGMLWGSTPDVIEQTIRFGINAANDETRFAEMLAFGKDQILDRDQLSAVVSYVRSLSGQEVKDVTQLATGKDVFAENCAGCHGDEGLGNTDLGAPDLTDAFWIYGGSEAEVYQTVYNGRAGHMPAWQGRLSDTEIKMLTAYLVNLRQNNN